MGSVLVLHVHRCLYCISIFFHSDPNTLFRGNSVASKVIDEFMKEVGHSYLHRTLQPCIDEVISRPSFFVYSTRST